MSVVPYFNLKCDMCNTVTDDGQWTIAEARSDAHDLGWRRKKINGEWLDICFDCLHPETDNNTQGETK
jgi:hypothetical protein